MSLMATTEFLQQRMSEVATQREAFQPTGDIQGMDTMGRGTGEGLDARESMGGGMHGIGGGMQGMGGSWIRMRRAHMQ